MLLAKTFCKPGSLIYIVPTGLLVTLRYDAHGQLNGIFKGFTPHGDELGEELPEDFRKVVLLNGLAPGGHRPGRRDPGGGHGGDHDPLRLREAHLPRRVPDPE